MKATVNPWTLELKIPENITSQPRLDTSTQYLARKAFTITMSIITLYDIIYVLVYHFENSNFGKIIFFSTLADTISVLIVLIFYILLPAWGFNFNGSSLIPMIILLVVEIEFNMLIYDYEEINAL